MDPLLHLVIALGMAVLLLCASFHKLADFAAFRRILVDYEVLPKGIVTPAAVVLVSLEVILGAAWLLQFRPTMLIAATVFLLACYTGGIALNLARDRVHISCGCGGHDGQPLSVWMLPRNLLLISAAMFAGLPMHERPLGLVDALTAAAALLILVLIYIAVSQLLVNAAAIRVWRAS